MFCCEGIHLLLEESRDPIPVELSLLGSCKSDGSCEFRVVSAFASLCFLGREFAEKGNGLPSGQVRDLCLGHPEFHKLSMYVFFALLA